MKKEKLKIINFDYVHGNLAKFKKYYSAIY